MSYREAPVLRKKYCERAYTASARAVIGGIRPRREGEGGGKQQGEIGSRTDQQTAAAGASRLQAPRGKPPAKLFDILRILGAGGQRIKNEVRKRRQRELAHNARISVPHGENAFAGRKLHFRELDRQILRQIISRVAITKKVRVEADDDRIPGRTRRADTPVYTYQLRLEVFDGFIRAVYGSVQEHGRVGRRQSRCQREFTGARACQSASSRAAHRPSQAKTGGESTSR